SAAFPAKPESPGCAADLLLPATMLASGGLPAPCPDLVMPPPALKRPHTLPACRAMRLPGITPEGVT
ncbi:MAG: hypothetical protein ACLP5E_22935, partial [Streptosporangiaceae bacterium]